MVGLAVGCLTYTSSGESDFSVDENGERHLHVSCEKVTGGKVKTVKGQESP